MTKVLSIQVSLLALQWGSLSGLKTWLTIRKHAQSNGFKSVTKLLPRLAQQNATAKRYIIRYSSKVTCNDKFLRCCAPFQRLYLMTLCNYCVFVLFYGNFIECDECSTVVQNKRTVKVQNNLAKLNVCRLYTTVQSMCEFCIF